MKACFRGLTLAAALLAGCADEGTRTDTAPAAPRPVASAPTRSTPAPVSTKLPPLVIAEEIDRPPSPDEIPPDVRNIPDAVPKDESVSAYGNPSSYEVLGRRYQIMSNPKGFREKGDASWYGKKFHGKRTSSGEAYDMFAMTAAHKTLPIPCYARITRISNGKSVIVRINDRGPFHDGRIVDLSYAAAARLEMLGSGSTAVELEVVTPADMAKNNAPASDRTKAEIAADRESARATARQPAEMEKLPEVVQHPLVTGKQNEPRYLQAGSFDDAINAAAFRDRLVSAGVKPLLMKSEQRNNRWVYRVLVGPFKDATKLDAARVKLTADATPTIPVAD